MAIQRARLIAFLILAGSLSGTAAWAKHHEDGDEDVVSSTTTAKANLNELKGTLQSKSDDSNSFRILVDSSVNVEFTYDKNTVLTNGGKPVTMDDLEYGDQLVVRYAGKELNAVEIERTSKAPRPL